MQYASLIQPSRRLLIAMLAFLVPLIVTGASAQVTIWSGASQNINCTAGVCAPTATSAQLNAKSLESLLKAGPVEVTTTGSGVQANNLVLSTTLAWATSNALTLDAYQSIAINSPLKVNGISALTIATNDGGAGGLLSFAAKASVTFANVSSQLTINGTSYTLISSTNSNSNSIVNLANAIQNNPNGYFALGADYDAQNDTYDGCDPVLTELDGVFEGLGHTISNFTLNEQQTSCGNIGLFATLGGTIADINLVRASVSCSEFTIDTCKFIGGLVAMATSGALVQGSSITGHVSASVDGNHADLGGLVGSGATITNSSSAAVVIGSGDCEGCIGPEFVGGLGGYVTLAENSHATGKVTNGIGGAVGGLVGFSSSITNSYATGSVSGGGGSEVGGLAGTGGEISTSFATGSVKAGDSFSNADALCGTDSACAGGLVGADPVFIHNSYATGSVSVGSGLTGAPSAAGGLVGSVSGCGTAEYCVGESYSTGALTGKRYSILGGLIGIDDGTSAPMVNDYWDLDTSNISDPSQGDGSIPNDPGITGLTTAQFQSGLPSGFDSATWTESEDVIDGLPYLICNPPQGTQLGQNCSSTARLRGTRINTSASNH